MSIYKETLPCLEINMKKSNSNSPKLLRNIRNHLVSSNYASSQIKAYSFFNKIEEKHKDNENGNKKNTNIFLKLSIENYKRKKYISSESNEIIKKENSIKVKQILDEIRRKTPSFLNNNKKIFPDKEDNSPGRNGRDNNAYLIFKENLQKHLAKKEKGLYTFLDDIYYDKNFLKLCSSNKNIMSNRKKIIEKENKKHLTPFINMISSCFGAETNGDSCNNTKDEYQKFNKHRLLSIEKNILNTNNEINKIYPKFNKRNILIRRQKSLNTKRFKFYEFYKDKDNNTLFKRYYNLNKE
jgi:hypothetical protein